MKALLTTVIVLAILLLSIGAYLHTCQIDTLTTISGRQFNQIQELEVAVFVLENRLAIADLGYADRDTSRFIPAYNPADDSVKFKITIPTDSLRDLPKGIRLSLSGMPVAYWEMHLAKLETLSVSDSLPLKPIWEQAVKEYWERR